MTKSKSRKLLEERLRGEIKTLKTMYTDMKQSRDSYKSEYLKLKQQIHKTQ